MADGGPASPDVLAEAVADAEEAAGADDHWDTLVAALRRARDAAGTPEANATIDALVGECERSNDFVRRGGREETRT